MKRFSLMKNYVQITYIPFEMRYISLLRFIYGTISFTKTNFSQKEQLNKILCPILKRLQKKQMSQ